MTFYLNMTKLYSSNFLSCKIALRNLVRVIWQRLMLKTAILF